MPKQPQDHKPSDGRTKFAQGGKTYYLPPVSEDASENVPFGITRAAIMRPDDAAAQARLGFAIIDAMDIPQETVDALDRLPTSEALELFGRWMGESSGSSA